MRKVLQEGLAQNIVSVTKFPFSTSGFALEIIFQSAKSD